jgi:hypothetical protein
MPSLNKTTLKVLGSIWVGPNLAYKHAVGRKQLAVKQALAYSAEVLITDIKAYLAAVSVTKKNSVMTKTPGANVIKLFTVVSYKF